MGLFLRFFLSSSSRRRLSNSLSNFSQKARARKREREREITRANVVKREESDTCVNKMGPPRSSKKKNRDGGGKKEAWMDDEIEMANKTVRTTSGKAYVKLDESSSSDEEEGESDEEEEEALMDLSSSDDDDDDDDSDDDDSDDDEDELDSDDDEAGLLRAMKAQKKKLEYTRLRNRAEHSDDDDEADGSDEDDLEENIGVRGKRKQDFYGDEEIDHEDVEEEEDRKDEEAAARAAQKQRAGKMRLGDFGLDDEEEDSEEEEEASSSSEEDDESEEDSEELTLQQKAQRSKLGAKKTPMEEEEEKEKGKKKKKKTKTSDGGSGGVVVEALDDDEKRAKREQLENASANADEAEEVRALALELQKTLVEVQTNVEPIVKSAKRGEYLTEEGISYLDTKYILLLSYCVNLVFYLLMKSEGKSIKDHPVVMRLVEIRSYIEKLRPIDKKLQYQVCFLCFRHCLFIFARLDV